MTITTLLITRDRVNLFHKREFSETFYA